MYSIFVFRGEICFKIYGVFFFYKSLFLLMFKIYCISYKKVFVIIEYLLILCYFVYL